MSPDDQTGHLSTNSDEQYFGFNEDAEDDFIEVEAFGHRFLTLRGNGEDLITLEREGAIYSHLWDEASQTFRYYRIPFLPSEIFQYVEAHVAQQQFYKAQADGASFSEAVQAIQNPKIRQRVVSYGNYGRDVEYIRGCVASFCPPEIEELACGGRPDRYELLPNLNQIDKSSLLIKIIDNFRVVARLLAKRGHNRSAFVVENEYDVQDLLFACVRSIFDDARTEEWTPKHAGTSKRVDIVIPSAATLIETKCVRTSFHAKDVIDEIKIDIESYHNHTHCKTLLVLIYDPKVLVTDPTALENDLSGRRTKARSTFNVQVMVRR